MECVFCEKETGEFGNNPAPLFTGEGRCCDKCNQGMVIPFRLYMISTGKNWDAAFLDFLLNLHEVLEVPSNDKVDPITSWALKEARKIDFGEVVSMAKPRRIH